MTSSCYVKWGQMLWGEVWGEMRLADEVNWCKPSPLLLVGFVWDEFIWVEFLWGRVNDCGLSLYEKRWIDVRRIDVRWIGVRWDGMRRDKTWQNTVDHLVPNSRSEDNLHGCVKLCSWLYVRNGVPKWAAKLQTSLGIATTCIMYDGPFKNSMV